MVDKCEECGKELPEDSDSLYCEECDERLDKEFDKIEDNIIVFKEITDKEVEVLKKFDDEDLAELYAYVYHKFSQDGINENEKKVLDKLKKRLNLDEREIDKKIEETSKLGKELCPKCYKPIKEDFNLCPYCGYKLNEEFEEPGKKMPKTPSPQEAYGEMFKSPGCIISIVAIVILTAVLIYFQFKG
ncbi:MAG: zinc ribbon domain-containing protein [Candidatus Humimicrobiaceae bacterium]